MGETLDFNKYPFGECPKNIEECIYIFSKIVNDFIEHHQVGCTPRLRSIFDEENINLCVSTDGFLDDLRVMSVQELFNRVLQLLTRFDAEKQINHLSTLSEYALSEHQFAQLVGKSRLFQYLPLKMKKTLDMPVPISDSQISTVGRDYYEDKSFCRTELGDIDMWKVYNLFTGATKSSYIDTFLDHNVGSLLFINGLIEHLKDKKTSWFLS